MTSTRSTLILLLSFLPALAFAQEAGKEPRKMHIKTITIIDGDTNVNESTIDMDDIDMEIEEGALHKVIRIDQDLLESEDLEMQSLETFLIDVEAMLGEAQEMTLKIELDGANLDDSLGHPCKKVIIKGGEPTGMKHMAIPMEGQRRIILEDGSVMDIDSILRANGIDPDSAHRKARVMVLDDEDMHHFDPELEGEDAHRVIIRKRIVDGDDDVMYKFPAPGMMGIDIEEEDEFFRMVPDPMSKGLVISAPGEGKFTLSLSDDQGNTLQKTVSKVSEGQFSSFISLKGLDSGTYFVKLKHGELNAKKKLIIH